MSKAATFPKSCRLLKSAEFASMRSKSVSIRGNGFRFIYKPSENKNGHSRLGLAVSSKVGGAVSRNKIKRLVRESFRKSTFSKPFDILFIPDPKINIEELTNDLERVLEKI